MSEITFAQSYLSKNSLITITFEELEAMARVIGYSFKDLEFVLDYKKAAGMASRMGCKSIYEYQQRWDQSLHLPFFPDIFYAGRGWRTELGEEDAWKDFIYADLVDYRIDRLLASESDKEHQTVLNETSSVDSTLEQVSSNITMPPRRVKKFHKPKKEPNGCYDYATAKQASIKLGFRSRDEYYKGRWQDPFLPSNPVKTYGDKFEDWPIFLGLCSIKETWEIIRQENCRFGRQYFELAKRYPKMPSHPSIYGVRWKKLTIFMMAAYAQK